jgi:hypothetical protein
VRNLVLLCALPAAAAAQSARGLIDGVVTDTNLVPIAGATVQIVGSTVEIVTLANGRFRFTELSPGYYMLSVRRVGYGASAARVELTPGDTARPSISLAKVTALDTVKVKGSAASPRFQEFETRRAFGAGEFMTPEEIDKRNTPRATELLRTFGSVNVVAAQQGSRTASAPIYWAVSRRLTGWKGACYIPVLIDEVPMPTPYDLEELPPAKELMGIEVYASSASVPIQYAKFGAACGLIIVWTKDGSSP